MSRGTHDRERDHRGFDKTTNIKLEGATASYADDAVLHGVVSDVDDRIDALEAGGGTAAHIADASDAHDASAISIVDAGALITATDVEGALQEIAGSSASSHIADPTDAHDASAISVADAGANYTATDVEAALAEVMDAHQAHEADASDAHDASAVSVVPFDTIAATNVQDALEEIVAEATGGTAVEVSDGTTTVSPTTLLSFDPDDFAVSDEGGDEALVSFIGSGGGGGSPPASGRATGSGSGNQASSGTGVQDITDASVTITTGATRVVVTFYGSCFHSASNGQTVFVVNVDGADVSPELIVQESGSSVENNASFAFLTDTLSAGSHTFKVRFRTPSGTATIRNSSSTNTWQMGAVSLAGSSGGPLASGKVVRSNTGSNETVASTAWEDIHASNYDITLTTGARRCLLIFTGRVSSTTAAITRFGFTVDGTPLLTESAGSTGNGITRHDTSSEGAHIIALTDVLTAGSHTFRPRWNASAGTSTLHETASTDFVTFQVIELPEASGEYTGLVHQRIERRNTGANISVTSTTHIPVDTTNLAITDTFRGGPVLLVFTCRWAHTSGTGTASFSFEVDGTNILSSTSDNGIYHQHSATANSSVECTMAIPIELSAGVHTIKPTVKTSGSTMTIHQTAATDLVTFSVTEIGLAATAAPAGYQAFCTANTAISAATTWTDITGMSLSLPPGTWDIDAYAFGDDSNSGTTSVGLAVHNGTTQVSSSATTKFAGANERFQLSVGARITLATTTTVKIQGMSTRGSSSTTFRTSETFSGIGIANTACRMRATQVTAS